MRILLFFFISLHLMGCSMPDETQFDECIKKRVEKNGTKLVYYLQTKQHYINNDLLLKKIKVTLLLPNGKEVNRKDSILFQRQKDGSWNCVQ